MLEFCRKIAFGHLSAGISLQSSLFDYCQGLRFLNHRINVLGDSEEMEDQILNSDCKGGSLGSCVQTATTVSGASFREK